MGSHARMFVALCAALTFTLALAAEAFGLSAVVRVETKESATSFNALVDRTQVAFGSTPITVQDADGHTATCDPHSAAAVLTSAVGPGSWKPVVTPPADPSVPDAVPRVAVAAIKGITQPPTAWTWAAIVDMRYVDDLCHAPVPDDAEALFFPWCTNPTASAATNAGCYVNGPLYISTGVFSPYFPGPVVAPTGRAPVTVRVSEVGLSRSNPFDNPKTFPMDAIVSTDAGFQSQTNKDDLVLGTAVIEFTSQGDHNVRATKNGRVPGRLPFCSTDGQDGYCGTTLPDQNPFVVPPSPCQTNGHDGQCGTTDTSGPPTTVTNIKNKQAFSRSSAPKKLIGTIALDASGVKQVLLRLTRVTTTRVAIKPKKKAKKKRARKASAAKKPAKKRKIRYRTVKRCTYWNTNTLLLEKAKRCGTTYGKWFRADVSDVPTAFSYDFAMKLPTGSYVLEVQGQDLDGHPEDVEPGRNVLTFRVK